MAKQPVWFSLNGVGIEDLTLTFDEAFLVADKSAIVPTVEEVGSGWYIVEYSGTGHAAATVNGGTEYLDFQRRPVEWNAPVGSVTGSVTVGTNNDKTGYALTVTPPTASDIATSVWAAGTRTLTSFGTLVADITTAVGSLITALKTSIKGWLFNRTNTVTDGKITSYLAGTGADETTVTVTYEGDVPTSETPS